MLLKPSLFTFNKFHMKWKERKYISKSSDKHRWGLGNKALFYSVGFCLSVLESWMFLLQAVVHFIVSPPQCSCLSFLLLIALQHYHIFFPPFSLMPWQIATCREFKMLLVPSCVAVQFNPSCLLFTLDLKNGDGQPASADNLRVPIPKI